MFVPAPFAFKEKTEQLAFIDEYAFAVLVSQNLQATHIPLLARQDGDDLVLEGHVARGNPHWKKLDNTESLAVFAGPHAYISPAWYASSPNVPTWNYVAVHAKGQLNALDDAATLEVIDRIMDKFEPDMARPESGSEQADYQQKLLRGIVGIQLRVTSLEGVRKLGQHKSAADKAGVYNGLVNTGRHDALDLIDYMQRHQIACPEG